VKAKTQTITFWALGALGPLKEQAFAFPEISLAYWK
jgi:hypothetical protein